MTFYFPFHLVSVSPWPVLMSFSVMSMMINLLMMLNESNFIMVLLNFLLMLLLMFQWWRDVIREGAYQGSHLICITAGLQCGMVMFILSEVMFFFSFFWGFFHLILSPSVEMGNQCPPMMGEAFNPYNIPLLNTVILLSSGVTITLCHHAFLSNKFKVSLLMIIMTLSLGVIFTSFQFFEYKESGFTISDSMYGSIFFLSTGFHGLHVLIGSIFIYINTVRMKNKEISSFHHFGFEACLWYWHFVDVVWLFLYIFVYWLIY
uniref:Cytochrome c oxidase subunit 3 n=1 Tax=Meteorus pulchricornis TaxID=51522 RepID=D8WHE2_9HYME|nr:cytochrome c oxidase subunit III [Meteorus pulchricornis]